MDHLSEERFRQVLARAASDESYRALQQQCDDLDQSFLRVLEGLSPADRETVTAYLKALGSAALRLTEIACEESSLRPYL